MLKPLQCLFELSSVFGDIRSGGSELQTFLFSHFPFHFHLTQNTQQLQEKRNMMG